MRPKLLCLNRRMYDVQFVKKSSMGKSSTGDYITVQKQFLALRRAQECTKIRISGPKIKKIVPLPRPHPPYSGTSIRLRRSTRAPRNRNPGSAHGPCSIAQQQPWAYLEGGGARGPSPPQSPQKIVVLPRRRIDWRHFSCCNAKRIGDESQTTQLRSVVLTN